MKMKPGSTSGKTLGWMSTEFASWEVEGRVYERVNSVLEDAEQQRFIHQALGAKGFRYRYRSWQSVRDAFGRLTGFGVKIETLLKEKLSADRNQTGASLTSESRHA